MAKLILSLDGQLIKEFTLSKERTTIGRKHRCGKHLAGARCRVRRLDGDS